MTDSCDDPCDQIPTSTLTGWVNKKKDLKDLTKTVESK